MVEEEETKLIQRDRESMERSLQIINRLRRKAQGNTIQELRRWREGMRS